MKRVRRLTYKAMEAYKERLRILKDDLYSVRNDLSNFINVNIEQPNIDVQSVFEDLIVKYHKAYETLHEYLTHVSTQESNVELINIVADHTMMSLKVDLLKSKLMESVREDDQTKRSSVSVSSKTSRITTKLALKKAHAEAAKVKLEYAEKEASVKREIAEMNERFRISEAETKRKEAILNSELDLLKCKEEAASAAVEAEVLEMISNGAGSVVSDIIPPQNKVNPADHIQKFLNSQKLQISPNLDPPENRTKSEGDKVNKPSTVHIVQTSNPSANENANLNNNAEISKFLLKKDLLMSRLTTFSDRPEAYRAWKSSFQSVVKDLSATASEEIDLLIKYLGPESRKHALSLRSVYVTDLVVGREKIWTRLDERFGAPELVKSVITNKLKNTPKINPKDAKTYYDLVDTLSEVEAIKLDKMFTKQMSFYDTSEGILPIVHKLPFNVQEKWETRAALYKQKHNDDFPPFSEFLRFIEEICKIKNDPGLTCCSTQFDKTSSQNVRVSCRKTEVNVDLSDPQEYIRCPIHKASHSLLDCRAFKTKSLVERKKIVKDNKICFRCLQSVTHKSADCKKDLSCSVCNSNKHVTIMHEFKSGTSGTLGGANSTPSSGHGGEPKRDVSGVDCKCTQVCGSMPGGKSCSKIVLVDVFSSSNPSNHLRTYAIMDDQSNRSLARPELFSKLGIDDVPHPYTLHSCSGATEMVGRKAFDCVVKAVNNSKSFVLPPLLECSQIPNVCSEIPTPYIASKFSHMQHISTEIPALDEDAEILLLIGRDLFR